MVSEKEIIEPDELWIKRLHNLVREHPDFEVVHEPVHFLYCFRYVPHGLTAERQDQSFLDRLNEEIVAAVQRQGCNLVTTTRFNDRVAIRMSICSHKTLAQDVDTTFEAIARWGRLLTICHCNP